jgi:2-polyprenyl-3-methyl-5-hydroxy-6-metoxy-1,4-benzoquinol methylase
MVVSSSPASEPDSAHTHPRASASIWHDVECGAYRVDLSLWRELAMQAGTGTSAQPLLDVGAGTGRVALDLAARGHPVTALDLDGELLDTLRERARAAKISIDTVCADARELKLECHDFAVCLVPMQTVQLMGGAPGRLAFLGRAREHLCPGGLLACAIVSTLDSFDCATGDLGPSPEIARVDGVHYVSRATRVHVGARTVRIERERRILTAAQAAADTQVPAEHNVIELDRVSATQLRHEGQQTGLAYAGTRSIPATRDHVGSEVVLFRA